MMSTVKPRTSAQYHERAECTRELAWRSSSGPDKTMFMRMDAYEFSFGINEPLTWVAGGDRTKAPSIVVATDGFCHLIRASSADRVFAPYRTESPRTNQNQNAAYTTRISIL